MRFAPASALALVLPVLSFVACQPRVYHREVVSVVPLTSDVMRCALGEARRLGYEVRENDPQEGTSLAERQLNPGSDAPPRFDFLTFDILGRPAQTSTAPSVTFRVSAVTLVHGGNGRGPHYLDPTPAALADRDRVVAACVAPSLP